MSKINMLQYIGACLTLTVEAVLPRAKWRTFTQYTTLCERKYASKKMGDGVGNWKEGRSTGTKL